MNEAGGALKEDDEEDAVVEGVEEEEDGAGFCFLAGRLKMDACLDCSFSSLCSMITSPSDASSLLMAGGTTARRSK